ncbi:hypothetical protein HN385_02330 [archaeon]|jgi:hypothetical protein|nr:hypothetical protein [archaeon]MBT3450742.1 hypothetical protein [archaeon]MBT6868833.1 hypothetical protein [archaeon]MBT7192946.1 hypothetical protein [archaeon]MBT7380912.1 hypothetical protein [archaeon]
MLQGNLNEANKYFNKVIDDSSIFSCIWDLGKAMKYVGVENSGEDQRLKDLRSKILTKGIETAIRKEVVLFGNAIARNDINTAMLIIKNTEYCRDTNLAEDGRSDINRRLMNGGLGVNINVASVYQRMLDKMYQRINLPALANPEHMKDPTMGTYVLELIFE